MAVGGLNYTPSKTVREFMLSQAKMRAIMGPVGCLPAESEFLTPEGWKRMDQYTPGDKVAQWSPAGEIEFVAPEQYIRAPQLESFHRFSNAHAHDMVLSSEHRVVFYDWKGALREETAEYIATKLQQCRAEGPRFYVPVTFRLLGGEGISLSDAELRLMVAVHADGHFHPFYEVKGIPHCNVVVRKERKKERLRRLLLEAEIPWQECNYPKRPTETKFIFEAPRLSKQYDKSWWSINQAQAEIIYDEFQHWDGLQHDDGEVRYYSKHKGDADFIQFVCHATGHRATISKVEYEQEVWADTYIVQATRRLDEPITFRNSTYSQQAASDGMKYCFVVPSSYFVARHNGRIFVTGNSGKTTGCIVELLRQAILMTPGKDGVRRSKMLVVRNTKQQLKDTTLASCLEILPIEIVKWRESEQILRIEFNDVKSDWLFRSLDTPEDVQRVLSLQVSWTWVEEAREVPVPLLSDLEGRTGRFPSQADGFRYRSGIIYSTNPPEIDSPHYKLLEQLPQVDGEENSVIDVDVFKQPSGLSPDAENTQNLRPGYYEDLAKGKPQSWIDVYVHGLYAESQYGKPVYRQSFKLARHAAPKPLPIDGNLPVVIGMDCARQPAAVFKQMQPDGRIFTLKEAYGFDMGAKTFIPQKLLPIIRNYFPHNPLIFIGDPSWVRQNETDDNSWFKELKKWFPREQGHTVKPAVTNDPTARINATDAALRSYPDGEPLYLIDPSCKWLIEALRSKYRYARLKGGDGKLHEKPEKNNWSHTAEANQYADMFLTGPHYNASDYVRVQFDPFRQQTSYRPACGLTGY